MIPPERQREVAAALAAAGVEAAAFEAKELVAAARDEAELADWLRRRVKGEPLQYLLGEWEFWGLTLAVGEGVLIPQPDTETLVEQGLDAIRGVPAPTVLDLCAGSGCVGLAVAKERPDAAVTAVEWYPEAFRYLEQNIRSLHLPVTAVQADVLAPPPAELAGPWDLILSNPPYLAPEEKETLSPEVLRQPRQALFGGEDGLVFYRAIRDRWLPLLKPGGTLAVEIGWKQGQDVTALFEAYAPRIVADYGGRDRVVRMRKTKLT